MIAHRVTFEIGEAEVGQSPPSVFERGTMSLGREQLVLDAPDAGTILDESIKRLRWCRHHATSGFGARTNSHERQAAHSAEDGKAATGRQRNNETSPTAASQSTPGEVRI